MDGLQLLLDLRAHIRRGKHDGAETANENVTNQGIGGHVVASSVGRIGAEQTPIIRSVAGDWCEITVVREGTSAVLYHNAFATNHAVTG